MGRTWLCWDVIGGKGTEGRQRKCKEGSFSLDRPSRRCGAVVGLRAPLPTFSLTVITLTGCVCFFNTKTKSPSIWLFFWRWTSLSYRHLLFVSKRRRRFLEY
jgi:hypothetical protein